MAQGVGPEFKPQYGKGKKSICRDPRGKADSMMSPVLMAANIDQK
jgi:hypothetical protein